MGKSGHPIVNLQWSGKVVEVCVGRGRLARLVFWRPGYYLAAANFTILCSEAAAVLLRGVCSLPQSCNGNRPDQI